jgi:uncharacterized membrane protein YfhO
VEPGEQLQPVTLSIWTPNRITARASGPGLFVLSEIYYPGWHAWMDGKNANIEVVAGVIRGVRLDSGDHQIEFKYIPASLYAGLSLGLLGLVLYIVLIKLASRQTEP